jgi:Protein of unknown function (DUF4236)
MPMPFRLSKRIGFPGGRVNFSKSGVSFSVGAPGSWLTLGKRGVRTTLGLSGTGLSWYQQTPWPSRLHRPRRLRSCLRLLNRSMPVA